MIKILGRPVAHGMIALPLLFGEVNATMMLLNDID